MTEVAVTMGVDEGHLFAKWQLEIIRRDQRRPLCVKFQALRFFEGNLLASSA